MLSPLHELLAKRPRKTHHRRSRKSSLALEMLEDRLALAACPGNGNPHTVGDLQFCGNFTQLPNGDLTADSNASNGVPILIGLAPQDVEPFNPLLEVDGVVEIPTDGDTMFTLGQAVQASVPTNLKLRHVVTSPTIWTTSNLETHQFDADLLSGTKTGAMQLPNSNNAAPKAIGVAGLSTGFLSEDIVFNNPDGPESDTTDAQTWLRGTISFDSIGLKSLSVGVKDQNHVLIDSQTGHISVTGVNAMIDVPNFQLKGVEFDGSLNVTYTETEGKQEFGFQGEVKLKAAGLKDDADNEELDVKIGAPGSAGLIVGNGDISSFEITLTGNIKVWELLIELQDLTFEYTPKDAPQFPDSFVMYGDLNVLVPNGAASENGKYTTIDGDFGSMDMPGFAINDSGVVDFVNIGVSGDLNLLGLKVDISTSNPARFSYDGTTQIYGLSGQLTFPQLLNAELIAGTGTTTGIKIENGRWSVDNLTLEFSDLNLGAFKLREMELTLKQFPFMTVTGDIASGGNTITNAMGSGTLTDLQPGQPLSGTGVPTNTRLASVNGTTLNLSKNTTVDATAESFEFDEGIDLDFELFVVFPNGWEVDADIDMLFDETKKEFILNEIFLKWQADNQESRVPIGDTGLFLTEIDAKLLNVNTPDVVVSGHLTVEYGDKVKFLGKDATLFSATGSFTVDKDHLELDATVYLGSFTSTASKPQGVIGEGTGQLLLDWNDGVYKLDVKSSMYKGAFTFEAEIEFDAGEGIFFLAEADVNVPHGVPMIGGKKLGSLDFLFKYEKPGPKDNNQAQGFVAAWTEINLLFKKVDAGIQYDFEKGNVEFIGAGTIKADLRSQPDDTSKPYTWQQQFTVPSGGATQGSLTSDWTRAFPAGANLTKESVTVVAETAQGTKTYHESDFSSSNGLTLLPSDNGQLIRQVGMVGSSTNDLKPLPVAGNKSYTLKFTVTSDKAPRKDTASVLEITSFENPDTSLSTLIKLQTLPGDLRVGDVVTVSGSSVSAYNTNHTVTEITADGQLATNQKWSADDKSGKASIKNWYVPQFHSTFHIPATEFASSNPITFDAKTGKVDFNVAIAGLQSLQTNTEIDVYVDVYNGSLPEQQFNGSPFVTGVKLDSTSGDSLTPVSLSASTIIDLTRLDPAFEYYVYGLVNDGTNPAALSPASQPFPISAAVQGTVLNVMPGQATGVGLAGWTVFADEDGDGMLEAGEIRTTTIDNGDYSFLPTQIESLSVLSIGNDSQTGNALVQLTRSSVHGLRVGSMLTLSGTTGYDGTFAITEVVSDSSIVIDQKYVAASSGGTAISSTDFPTSAVDLVLIRLSDNYVFETPSDGKSSFTYDGSNTQQATFLLNEKSAIKGKLVDASGDPLAGWVIYFDQNKNGIWDNGEDFRSTNSAGEYYFGSPAPDDYTVALAISTGAVANIQFENVAGTQVLDSSNSGVQHSGTLMNGATPGTADSFGIPDYPGADANNQIVRLDGKNQFVQFDPTRDFVPGTGPFSFATWVRVDDPTAQQAIAGSAGAALPSDGWALLLSYNGQSQKPYLYMAQNDDVTKTMEVAGNVTLEADTWYHVAFAYDGTNDDTAVTMYIDGVPVKTTIIKNTLDGSPVISNEDQVFFNLGGQGSSASLPNSVNTLTGYTDDMAAWREALSQPQFQAHYLGATMPAYVQTSPDNPPTYSITIDNSGTDVQEGIDFAVRGSAAVSGAVSVSNSNSPNFLGQFTQIGGAVGSHSTGVGSKYSVESNGRVLAGTSDKISMVHSDFAGDGVFTALVTSVGSGLINPTPDAQGGVMVRSSTDANSAFVAIWTNVDNSIGFQWRTDAGQQASTAVSMDGSRGNKWLRLERKGNVFTASYSTDGSNYTVLGTQTVDLLSTSLFGLYATSGNNSQSEVKFSSVAYTDNSPPQQGMIQVLEQGMVVASEPLFGDGSYLIPNLPAGSYEIKQIPPTGFFQTSPFYNAISYSNSEFDSANSQLMNSITVADFDGDGKEDLAYLTPSNSMIEVAYGVGDGTFAAAESYPAGPGISDPVQITSSAQKNSDLWIVDGKSGQVNWLENLKDGRGTQFQGGVGKVLIPSSATAVDSATGQLIKESIFGQGMDIGIVPHPGSCCVKGSGIANTLQSSFGDSLHFQYFEASGDGMITARLDQSYGIDGGASWVSAGVMIRAGLEIGANFASTSIDGRGEGSFPPSYGAFNHRNGGTTQNAQRQTFELDNNFGVRLIKTGNSIQSWVNYVDNSGYKWYLLGEETVELGETFYVGFFASSSAASNAGGPGALNSATFQGPSSSFTSSSQAVVSYRDNSGGKDTGFRVIESFVTGKSETIYTSPNFLYAGDVTIGDINRDGKQDVVMNGGNNLNEVTVAIGDGTGQFSIFTVPMPTSFTNGGAIKVLDVNNDGRRDIVAADSVTGKIEVMLQDQGGGFPLSSSETLTTVENVPVGTLEVEDMNGDGKPEVVALPVGGQNNNVNIFVNSLFSHESIFGGQPLEFSSLAGANADTASIAFALGDFNGDSLEDLIAPAKDKPIAGLLLSEANPKEETIPVTLVPGSLVVGNDFLIRPQAQVSGTTVADNNRNGRIDGADSGLAGAMVFVDANRNGDYDLGELQTITDSHGGWSFDGLANGSYRIALFPVSGHLPTLPEGDWESAHYEVEVTSDSQSPANNFLVTHNRAAVIESVENTGLRTEDYTAEGDDFGLTVTFTDPDGHENFTTIIDWGDGSETTAITAVNDGLGAARATHAYAAGGTYEINVRVIDQHDDAVVSYARQIGIVAGAGVQDGVLNIVGTRADDQVEIISQADMTEVHASFLPQSKAFSDFDSIRVQLFEGDDSLSIDRNVVQSALVFGGDGRDILTGGGGNDEVLGEEGDDVISGNHGNDLLIGGIGSDSLVGDFGNDILQGNEGDDRLQGDEGNDVVSGGSGEDRIGGGNGRDLLIGGSDTDYLSGTQHDDILIGGHTSYDENAAILSSIIAEWFSAASYRARIENLRTGDGAHLQGNRLVNGLTVHDDGVLDTLDGGTGIEFYFAVDGEIVELTELEGWVVLDNTKPGYTFIYIDTRLMVHGTEGDNNLVWSGDQGSTLQLDWFEFPVIDGTQHIDYFAEGGNDNSHLIGADGDDIFEAHPAFSTFETAGYTVTVVDSETVLADAVQGGLDTATLHDGERDDTYTANPDSVQMTDGLYLHTANGFDSATGTSSGQSRDEAVMSDSDQPDALTVRPGSVLLTGSDFAIAAVGFLHTSSISDVGTGDTATVIDSQADDQLVGSLFSGGMSEFTITGGNYNQHLRGFEATTVNAINGGTNELHVTDSPVDDLLQLTPLFMEMTGSGSTILANGFTHQVITSGGGNDSVEFLDSVGNDQFYSEPQFSVMQGNNFLNRTNGYSNVRASASRLGDDEITILGSDGPDHVVLSGSGGNYNGQALSRQFDRFDRATVFFNSNNDDLQINDIDYQLTLIDQANGYIECDGQLRLIGDSNHDGVFNSSDLVQVFKAGKYEDGTGADFEEGDWNCDGEFDSSDLVLAFQAGNYVAEARTSPGLVAAAVDGLFAREEDKPKGRPFVA